MRIAIAVLLCTAAAAFGDTFHTPLTPGGSYDPAVPAPAAVLGFVPGDRAARYDQVVAYCRRLTETSARVRMMALGQSTEGRAQYYLVISDPANLAALDRIRAGHARLADPRQMQGQSVASLAATLPAVVWIGYGIHGNELSSTDASLHVAYQLAAGTDSVTMRMNRELIVCLDPMENPDGRERYLAMMEQWNGPVPNADEQSIHHNGLWPGGRGNHYLFDLNRDWFALVHPETRARVAAVLEWHPHVFIDSHEMGGNDTYLFSPPREPINPNVSAEVKHWWSVFSKDQARAFDRFGWSYYTREWNDDWFPGYANSWAHYTEAVGILYEQAGVDGSLVARPDGTELHYKESVHHHVVSSLANCETAARHREELLTRYAAARRDAMRVPAGHPRAYAFLPGDNPARVEDLVRRLRLQGIEVQMTVRDETVSGATAATGGAPRSVRLPKGTSIVAMDQPSGRLARAILEFDPRMSTATLQEERKSLEKKGDSRFYDVTAWSLPLAFGVEAWALPSVPGALAVATDAEAVRGGVEGAADAYGYIFRYDDRGVQLLVDLFARGFKVRAAREPFTVDGRSYDRGSLLLRVRENPDTLRPVLHRLAADAGVRVHAVPTALSTGGPDLGGNDQRLLTPPRVALVAGPGVSSTTFGAVWHLCDRTLGIPATLIPFTSLPHADLRRYNVLVLPPAGSAQGFVGTLGTSGIAQLRAWIEAGGTLIGVGGASAILADTATGLSGVRLRHQALKDLDLFTRAAELERKAETPVVDSVALWSGTMVADSIKPAPKGGLTDKELTMMDERGRLFMPPGTLLRADLDREHWLSYGAGAFVAAMTQTSSAFLSKGPVETAARYAGPAELRLSGLLWPEARDRWARTAYLTREAKGRGQVILFAGDPVYRASFPATERLLINAVLLGPGLGTKPF